MSMVAAALTSKEARRVKRLLTRQDLTRRSHYSPTLRARREELALKIPFPSGTKVYPDEPYFCGETQEGYKFHGSMDMTGYSIDVEYYHHKKGRSEDTETMPLVKLSRGSEKKIESWLMEKLFEVYPIRKEPWNWDSPKVGLEAKKRPHLVHEGCSAFYIRFKDGNGRPWLHVEYLGTSPRLAMKVMGYIEEVLKNGYIEEVLKNERPETSPGRKIVEYVGGFLKAKNS